jgi:hypothetical protein
MAQNNLKKNQKEKRKKESEPILLNVPKRHLILWK